MQAAEITPNEILELLRSLIHFSSIDY